MGGYLREPQANCEIRSRPRTAAEGEGEIAHMVESSSSRWTPQEDALFRRMAEATPVKAAKDAV